MRLETTIPLRRDGTLGVSAPSGTRYAFEPDPDTGMPACDVENATDAAWMLECGDFYPANEADVEAANALLSDGADDGEDDDGEDDDGDEDGDEDEYAVLDDLSTGELHALHVEVAGVAPADGADDETVKAGIIAADQGEAIDLDAMDKADLQALYREMTGDDPDKRWGVEKLKDAIEAINGGEA